MILAHLVYGATLAGGQSASPLVARTIVHQG